MPPFLKDLLGSDGFMPHGYCYRWQADVVWLNVVADLLITLAYYAIPLLLIYLVRKRRDLAFHWMFLMFGTFIFLCGTTHLVEVLTVWSPQYKLAGLIKLVTGIFSLITAAFLVKIVPRALALKSPAELAATNERLASENEQRRKTEQELARAKLEYETIFNSVPALIWYKDTENRVLRANEPFARLSGIPLGELPGKHFFEIFPEQSDTYKDDLEVLASETPKLGISEQLQSASGEKRWFRTDKVPYRDAAGNIVGVIVFSMDITDAIRLEENRDDLMSALAHDLKLPVIGAQRVFKLLTAGTLGPLNEKQKEFLDKLLDSNTRMLAMIQTLVDVHRYDKSAYELLIEETRMAELIGDSLDELKQAALEKGINVSTNLDQDLVVEGDRLALYRLLNNLLDNAVKFCRDHGAIAVELKAGDDGQAVLAVSNDGDPIPPEQQHRLFQRFWQGGAAGHYSAGTGLGLYLCRQIVEAHNGNLGLSSEPGKHTTFFVSLPTKHRPSGDGQRHHG